MKRYRVLHLVGSASSEFYSQLSQLYAKDCLEATTNPQLYDMQIALITPDRQWRFPTSLNPADIAAAAPMPISDAIRCISTQAIDVVLPQMFCIPGMTAYRALLDVLQIPYVGNQPDVMAIATHKARAKAIVAAAGVPVPQGELLRRGDFPTIKPPAVVKPVNADNSFGVSFVADQTNYHVALDGAFDHAEEVLVEEYIELGREVRCGVIVKQGELIPLPLEEYFVDSQQHPIRNYSDKLKTTTTGELSLAAKDHDKAWIVELDDPIVAVVQQAAKVCHQALGCRHYSLFDFRISPQGQPYFLEAGLYCSFSPKSVIACMAKKAGLSLPDLLQLAINEALTN